jgi:hypothetical protein
LSGTNTDPFRKKLDCCSRSIRIAPSWRDGISIIWIELMEVPVNLKCWSLLLSMRNIRTYVEVLFTVLFTGKKDGSSLICVGNLDPGKHVDGG